MAWFQEIKRDLIYCRVKRCTCRTIQPDLNRLLGYLINTLSRMVSLYNCKGRNAEGLKVAGTTKPNWCNKCNVFGYASSLPTLVVTYGTFLTLAPTQPTLTTNGAT